jgi:hypothetical protein
MPRTPVQRHSMHHGTECPNAICQDQGRAHLGDERPSFCPGRAACHPTPSPRYTTDTKNDDPWHAALAAGVQHTAMFGYCGAAGVWSPGPTHHSGQVRLTGDIVRHIPLQHLRIRDQMWRHAEQDLPRTATGNTATYPGTTVTVLHTHPIPTPICSCLLWDPFRLTCTKPRT